MRPIWKGSINFGLVNIPVALFPATKTEELRFRLLRGSDLSPVNYKRVAERDGKEVPWDQIVKGYEYEKGKFIVLKEEDFRRVDVEATQSVEITDFVDQAEVNPVFFHKPYYMEPLKGADRAYILLREALEGSGKIGIAKVVIKTRQHLAAVKPQEEGLMLVLMHFPAELRDVDEFKQPRESKPASKELTMAKALIESMTSRWDPADYKDDYRAALEDLIEEKLAHPDRRVAAPKTAKRQGNVIDLVAVLQRSLDRNGKPKRRAGAKAGAGKPRRGGGAPAKRAKSRRAA
jgi:DNA end-binding protein Ku